VPASHLLGIQVLHLILHSFYYYKEVLMSEEDLSMADSVADSIRTANNFEEPVVEEVKEERYREKDFQ